MEEFLTGETFRLLGGGESQDEGHDDDHSEFGVHVTYNEIYYSIIFLTSIYVCGQIASRLLKMPSLVGEICAGILLGPPLGDIVPIPEAFVLLGEIGYVVDSFKPINQCHCRFMEQKTNFFVCFAV